jgi:hypothetical protein
MIVEKNSGSYYKIEGVQHLPPFFISIAGASDVWMYLSSNGAPAAGRQNANNSIFPYETDDRLHLATSTGPKTLVRLPDGRIWQPFHTGYENPYAIQRNLYKRITGDAVLFEEINEDAKLVFSYRWETSEKYGLVRTAEIENLSTLNTSGKTHTKIEILDGIENIMPYGISAGLAMGSSCLTDAYKACERPNNGRLAVLSLTSMIADSPEPIEVLRANTVWYIGNATEYHLSSRQIPTFARGEKTMDETRSVGRKGAFFVSQTLELTPGVTESWLMVLDARKSQKDVVILLREVNHTSVDELREHVTADIKKGTHELVRIVAAADGLQKTNDTHADIRHYMNVLYNNKRGGVFLDGYALDIDLFIEFLTHRNKDTAKRRVDFLEKLKADGVQDILTLHDRAALDGDPDLIRLVLEFLPLTFSRRHGDPSRPWNWFNIRVKDENGNRLYHYEGNWRDIFQNWEAMGLSFPVFLAPMITKFLNASTPDGFNPYRINHEGIDWEMPTPHDPWSGSGYWGDHQIVYLNKLLEWLMAYAPKTLQKLTEKDIFTYANVPYEIVPYERLLVNAKNTIKFNREKHDVIMARLPQKGTDARLLPEGEGLYHVSFTEKLLVPILAKLSNLVINGGIWMNTQRPEWNDANNAIVGNGLSMVTVYQLYRHLDCCLKLTEYVGGDITLSAEVKTWFADIFAVLKERTALTPREFLDKAGKAFCRYRSAVYANGFSGREIVDTNDIKAFYKTARETLGETIDTNKRPDGMYHSYNILTLTDNSLSVAPMFLMLEGQTAVLGSGKLNVKQALDLTQTMENSDLMNPKLGQFFLYPIKNLNTFVERNIIPPDMAAKSALITTLLDQNHDGFIIKDAEGFIRFHDGIQQSTDVENRLTALNASPEDAAYIREIYEHVFAHKQFTGRSGIMYKYEGIGSVYWHQNSKFMLSLQEVFTNAESTAPTKTDDLNALKETYYRLQKGFGFRKTPEEWGAFPLEPYSHTPYEMPAQQPGMTGQVKEDILTRMAELGIYVKDGVLCFRPALLCENEFLTLPGLFRYMDASGLYREVSLPVDSLAFTVCQVPVIYQRAEKTSLTVYGENEEVLYQTQDLTLNEKYSTELFTRNGRINKITLYHSFD